jgi:hypothetical protein
LNKVAYIHDDFSSKGLGAAAVGNYPYNRVDGISEGSVRHYFCEMLRFLAILNTPCFSSQPFEELNLIASDRKLLQVHGRVRAPLAPPSSFRDAIGFVADFFGFCPTTI